MKSKGIPDSQQIRLVFEFPTPERPPENHLTVPLDVSFLHAPSSAAPQLLTAAPACFEQFLILEPIVTSQHQRRLLVLNPADGLLQVKGQPVPRVAVLAETDEFRLNDGPIFHVTVFHQRRVGPPDAALIGKQCPICRVAFTASSNVYMCPCGGGVHLESAGEEVGVLDCLPLCEQGFCPMCHKQPIATQDGYAWFPDLIHG